MFNFLRQPLPLTSAVLVALLFSACSPGKAVEPGEPVSENPTPIGAAPFRMQAAGYHPSWMGNAWTEYDFDLLDVLFFFDLPVSADGRLEDRQGWPHAWVGLIAESQAHGVPIHVTVSLLDASVFRSVFSSESHVQQLIDDIADVAASGSVDGIHLDVEVFEPVAPLIRDAYTRFVSELRTRLGNDRPGLSLSLFLTAFDTADAFDEAALVASSDFVVVQGYDLHWLTGDTAGPLSPVRGWKGRSWETILARYDALGVDRGRMLFSVPYYGYEWPTEGPEPGARTVAHGALTTFAPVLAGVPSAREQAAAHGLRRDAASGSPWYLFSDSTGWRQGWFEDAESLGRKYDFTKREGLAGVAVFPLSYGDASLDSTLRAARLP